MRDAKKELHVALYDKNYRQDVRLRDESPAIMLAQKGVKNLPMVMKASHIRENVFTEEEAKAQGLRVDTHTHYHGLGEEFFLKVIDGLDDVDLAYRGTKNAMDSSRRENYFLLISKFKDANGNTVNVPVYINEHAQYNRVFVDVNKISTVFGRDNFETYINNQIKNGSLVRIKNRSNKSSERNALIAKGYGNNASKDSISKTGENATKRFSISIDSQGRELTKEQIKYFEDSKVRDAEGNLLEVYHGTNSDQFTVFDSAKSDKKAKLNVLGDGFYFAPNKDKASRYGQHVMDVYLNMKNPYRFNGRTGGILSQLEDDFGGSADNTKRSEIQGILRKNGFDGVLMYQSKYDESSDFVTAVVFEPNQIKKVDNYNPTQDEDIRYSLNDATLQAEKLFAEEYDAWDKNNPTKVFKVTVTSEALKEIGIDDKAITMDSSKIIKIRSKHKGMTDAVIKKIPRVINEPMLILESKTAQSRVVMLGELVDEDGKTVLVVLELNPTNRKGIALDEIQIASAYGKDNLQNFVNASKILYVNPDNAKTSSWLTSTRLQLPVESLTTGSTDSIPSTNSVVKNDLRYSLNDATDLSDFWFNNDNLEEPIENAASILEEGAKLLQGKEVDTESIRRIARGMVKEYQSHYNVDTLSENLEKLFSYMQSQDKVSYDDMVERCTIFSGSFMYYI